MIVQAIKVHEGPGGTAFVLVCLESGHAQLMLVGASLMDEATWDAAVRFCWAAGWEPQNDDPDVFIASIDTEFYLLREVAHEETEEAIDVRNAHS